MGNKSNNKEHTSTKDSTKLIDIQKRKTKNPDNRHLNTGKTNKNEPQNMDVNTFKTESTGPDTKVDDKTKNIVKTNNSQLVLTSTDPPYRNFNWNDPILNSPLWEHQLKQFCKQSSISIDLSKKLVFGSEGLNSKSLIGNLKEKIYEVKFVVIYGKNEEEISYNLKLKDLEKNSIIIDPDSNKKMLSEKGIDYEDLLHRETKSNLNFKHKNIRVCYGIFDIDYFSCFVSTL